MRTTTLTLIIDFENIIRLDYLEIIEYFQNKIKNQNLNHTPEELYLVYLKAKELFGHYDKLKFKNALKEFFNHILILNLNLNLDDFPLQYSKLNAEFVTRILDQYKPLFSEIILVSDKSLQEVHKFIEKYNLYIYIDKIFAEIRVWRREDFSFLEKYDPNKTLFISSNPLMLFFPSSLNFEILLFNPIFDEPLHYKVINKLYERWYDEIINMWSS